jgi:hypothetical protein
MKWLKMNPIIRIIYYLESTSRNYRKLSYWARSTNCGKYKRETFITVNNVISILNYNHRTAATLSTEVAW